MMKVPWRRVFSWHCSACGRCCYKYEIRLNFYEYLRLKQTGFVEEKLGRYYIKKIGDKCPFQIGKLCSLQKSLKPLACRLYPFTVLLKGDEEALYEYNGEEYYVYVELGCPNLRIGNFGRKIEPLVREAVEVATGRGEINLITSNLPYGNVKETSSLQRQYIQRR